MASEVVKRHTLNSLKTTKAARQTQVKRTDVQAQEGTKRQSTYSVRRMIAAATIEVR